MSIKLVAIDMDGTLLNEHGQLNPATINAVKAAKVAGVKIVLCTGRPLPGIQQFLPELELNEPGDYAITYNGALVQHTSDGHVLAKHTLTYADYLRIEYVAQLIGVHSHAEDEVAIYTANHDISSYTVNEVALVNMPLKFQTADQFSRDHVFSKMMLIDDPEILAAAQKNLPADIKEDYYLVNSEPYYLEVLNKKASKGNGLADLANHLGIDVSETMAIGDQANDLSMLEYAGTAVAMGNAIDAVKNIANVVTETNINDGVAKAINDLVLGD
ncbi:sugar-phosphatase [Lacticaseibacillus brantae]|uniref:HAD superfamily hydrolase n=1 Tax=Lacticaseibacillus brantae DSM 23927 TaxID=1423727 RepID=A0A0R2AV64_9LACO|nr:sugar-phosphatase [Lacticaseibacillus brantae]KRM71272.1 hypothetical protein FC34_GL001751 [Lacticaseibacillus brantae DSM 23927]